MRLGLGPPPVARLRGPRLSTLQKMSDIAGVRFFGGAAASLAEPLISSVQAPSEATGSGGIQIVYAGNLPLHSGILLLAAVEAQGFAWRDYSFARGSSSDREGLRQSNLQS